MNPLDSAFLHSTALHWNPEALRFDAGRLLDRAWSALDLGAVHGAFLVERIRTLGGELPDVSRHLARLNRGFETLRIDSTSLLSAIAGELDRLVRENSTLIAEQRDVSLVIVVSPGTPLPGNGRPGIASPDSTRSRGGPNCLMHCSPMPWMRLKHWYEHGTSLRRCDWASGAGVCWPGEIKSRARLNYYLADLEAARYGPFDLAVLTNGKGGVADTSVANVLLVTDRNTVVSPQPSDIVFGTSLQRVQQLLHRVRMQLVFRDVRFEELFDAQEVWLTGNTGCLWSAASLDGATIGAGPTSQRCLELQRAWIEDSGFDWLSQVKTT